MMNRKFFFEQVQGRLFGGALKPTQTAGLTAIVDEWEAKHQRKDDRWLAYMLATTHHETDRTMRPIEEYGRGKGRPYGVRDPVTGKVYYGRGFVQLTWKANYAKLSKVVAADLVAEPERALELPIATAILFYGMMNGSFTGKKLGDYFGPDVEDWRNARRIINGTDKADLIGDYAKRYYGAISYTN